MEVGTTPKILAGRYRVLERLGAGGMATVYLAEDDRLGRKVAVKRLHSDSPEDAARRFEREAKVGASLSHPNLVTVFDTVADGDSVLIVMEYVAGENLAKLMARRRVPSEQAVSIIRQIAGALDHAHKAGVVHRDVKPANILISPDDKAKLVDLGIATASERTQITQIGTVLGTPSYMATEPVPDIREAWPDAPSAAAGALCAAMARDPRHRQRSAGQLARELDDAFKVTQPATTRAPSPETTQPMPVAPIPVAPVGVRAPAPQARRASALP